MFRHARWTLLVLPLFFWPAVSPAQQKAKPKVNADEVEVRFADGSTVRMVILQETIDVQTKYGKLAVPVKDIRRIEFGLHLPEETTDKIDKAIQRLNSEAFKDREAAQRELIELGAVAYPAAYRATQSLEPEVVQRARAVLKSMRAKIPAKELRLKADDYVRTLDFPVVGRIVSPALKARTSYFGALDLKIGELRGITWLAGSGETVLTVDSQKHGTALNQWMDTGIMVEPDVPLSVVATGEIDLLNDGSGQFITGPRGTRNVGGRGGQFPPGALVGKIGDTGATFLVGDRYDRTPTQEGKLYLAIIPGPWNNQVSGSFEVKIATGFSAGR
jgi:hypothetical protein